MNSIRIYAILVAAASLVATARADVPPDVYDPRAAFAETDLDKNGYIDIGEFHARLIEVFYAADLNKDGYLEKDEWEKLPFHASLEKVDRDDNGKISLKEFVRIRLHQFILVDTNDDGELELDEVIAAYEGRQAE